MAKITLPTNYRDDILNPSAEGKRKYVMTYNQDGTVSFEDVTPYEQVGSDYGAGDINTTNEAVNESFDKNKLIKDLDTINALTEEGYAPDALAFRELTNSLTASDSLKFQFATDGEGRYGYLGADDSFIPFKSDAEYEIVYDVEFPYNTTNSYTFTSEYQFAIVVLGAGREGAITSTTCTPSDCNVTTLVNWTKSVGTVNQNAGGYIGIVTDIVPNLSKLTMHISWYGRGTILGIK